MNQIQKEKLKAAGWIEATVAEWLGLAPAEEWEMEATLVLCELVRETRAKKGWTPRQLAARLSTTPTTVSHMEQGAREATFDLLFRALFALGVAPSQIGAALSQVSIPAPSVSATIAPPCPVSSRRVAPQRLQKPMRRTKTKVAA